MGLYDVVLNACNIDHAGELVLEYLPHLPELGSSVLGQDQVQEVVAIGS